ncbi:hypothetical protein JCM10908_007029 [Rhodotorula pacifica]|uniref:uncharacterized protein n=1 Tax=Rhodotorula pacifica TaxID=1495444 RepID=UPI003170D5DE
MSSAQPAGGVAGVQAKQEVSERNEAVPACDRSEDGSVGTRSTPGPETPRAESAAGDAARRRSSGSSTMSNPTRRSEFSIGSIPPFRGRKGETAYGGLSGTTAIIEEQTEKPRRSSGPSVFMIPAPAPIVAPPAAFAGAAPPTGLGIEGLSGAASMQRTQSRDLEATGDSKGVSLKRSLASGETDERRTDSQVGLQQGSHE